jgi:hypothetical protein
MWVLSVQKRFRTCSRDRLDRESAGVNLNGMDCVPSLSGGKFACSILEHNPTYRCPSNDALVVVAP